MCLDREYDSESQKWGLVLSSAGSFFQNLEVYTIIILHQVDNGKYERAGIVSLSYEAYTGDLKLTESRTSWEMHLDEKSCAILEEERRGPPSKYSFLEGKEWRTVCLV